MIPTAHKHDYMHYDLSRGGFCDRVNINEEKDANLEKEWSNHHILSPISKNTKVFTLNITILRLLRQTIEVLRLNLCTSIQAPVTNHQVLSASSHFFVWFRILLSSYLTFQTFSLVILISSCIFSLSFRAIQSTNLLTVIFLCVNPLISLLPLYISSIKTDFLLTLLSVWRYFVIDYYFVPFRSAIYCSIHGFH